MTEREWTWRVGHSCELLDEDRLVVIGGRNKYNKNVDILNLGSFSWSKVKIKLNEVKQYTGFVDFQGPHLPVEMDYDFSIVYQDTLFIIETSKGFVYSIPTSLTGRWKNIGELGKLPSQQVFPAPVLKESDFKCV